MNAVANLIYGCMIREALAVFVFPLACFAIIYSSSDAHTATYTTNDEPRRSLLVLFDHLWYTHASGSEEYLKSTNLR